MRVDVTEDLLWGAGEMAQNLREFIALSRGLGFHFQHFLGGSESTVTLVPEDLMPSFGLSGH